MVETDNSSTASKLHGEHKQTKTKQKHHHLQRGKAQSSLISSRRTMSIAESNRDRTTNERFELRFIHAQVPWTRVAECPLGASFTEHRLPKQQQNSGSQMRSVFSHGSRVSPPVASHDTSTVSPGGTIPAPPGSETAAEATCGSFSHLSPV